MYLQMVLLLFAVQVYGTLNDPPNKTTSDVNNQKIIKDQQNPDYRHGRSRITITIDGEEVISMNKVRDVLEKHLKMPSHRVKRETPNVPLYQDPSIIQKGSKSNAVNSAKINALKSIGYALNEMGLKQYRGEKPKVPEKNPTPTEVIEEEEQSAEETVPENQAKFEVFDELTEPVIEPDSNNHQQMREDETMQSLETEQLEDLEESCETDGKDIAINLNVDCGAGRQGDNMRYLIQDVLLEVLTPLLRQSCYNPQPTAYTYKPSVIPLHQYAETYREPEMQEEVYEEDPTQQLLQEFRELFTDLRTDMKKYAQSHNSYRPSGPEPYRPETPTKPSYSRPVVQQSYKPTANKPRPAPTRRAPPQSPSQRIPPNILSVLQNMKREPGKRRPTLF